MSEYAIRIADNTEIYIGSCNVMRGLRYEDRLKVRQTEGGGNINPNNCLDLIWRLPIPDEDQALPGGYEGSGYYQKDSKCNFYRINYHCLLDNTECNDCQEEPGIFQLRKEYMGLLVNVTCYHGFKLNESNNDIQFAWNGKGNVLCLSGIKNTKSEIRICFSCVACNNRWSISFEEIQHLMISTEMQKRLFKICSEYWEERNPGKDYPHAITKKTKNEKAEVKLKRRTDISGNKYLVSIDTEDGDSQTDYFKTLEDAYKVYTGYL